MCCGCVYGIDRRMQGSRRSVKYVVLYIYIYIYIYIYRERERERERAINLAFDHWIMFKHIDYN